jgi:hypothetical protein
LIVIITFTDLPAGDNVHIFETGGYPYKQKNVKEPGFSAKPAIKRQTKPDANDNRQDNGNTHTGNHCKTFKKLAVIIGHEKPSVAAAQKRYFLS